MALPQVPRRLSLVEAPTTRNMAATPDAAAPYKMLAQQLSLFGGAANEIAKAGVPEAAQQAVTKDEAGNIVVNRVPFFGDAAPAYNRAVKLATVAAAEIQINGDVAKMRQQFKADPESFEKAVEEYRNEKTEQYNQAGGPEVGSAIGTLINRAGTWNLRGLTIEKQKKDQRNSTGRLKTSADEKADDLVALMGEGATSTPDFKSIESDYSTVLDEAAGNKLVSFTPQDAAAHREDTVRRGREAAIVGTALKAFNDGGLDGVAAVRPALEAVASPEERDNLTRRIAFDVGTAQAAREDEALSQVKADMAEDASRLSHGIAQLASGAVDESWLSRNAHRIGQSNYQTMRLAGLGPMAMGDEPQASSRLLDLALSNQGAAEREALDAYAGGLVTKPTMAASVLLAAQVAQDAAQRPWANEVRRTVAAQTKDIPGRGALDEFSQWLSANDKATPTEAQEVADAIVDRYQTQDRRRLAATLPIPYGLTSAPSKPDHIEASRAALAKGAADGTLTLGDIAQNAALLDGWRRAIAPETRHG